MMRIQKALISCWPELQQMFGSAEWETRQLALWRALRQPAGLATVEAIRGQLASHPSAIARMEHQLALDASAESTKGLFDGTAFARRPYVTIPLLYATDRQADETQEWNAYYGPERGNEESVQFGRADVSIPERHQIGKLEVPRWWKLEFREDPERHVSLLGLYPRQTQQAFFEELEALLRASAKQEVLIFVHGFKNSFADAARRAAQLAVDSEFPGPVILYSWPSEDSTALYTHDADNVEWSAPHFVAWLELLRVRFPEVRFHILAHSMGSRLVRSMLERQQPLVTTPGLGPLGEVVFAAPDVDRAIFRNAALASFGGKASRITLYASKHDKPLRLSQKVNGHSRAGDSREGVLCVPGIDSIDASPADASLLSLGHSYIGDCRELLQDLYYLMAKGMSATERHGLEPVPSLGKREYWRLRA